MAKLYFRYGAMNCGKSSALLQVAYNYEEKGKKVVIIKSILDTKGGETLVSRTGLVRKCDLIVNYNEGIYKYGKIWKKNMVSCILVDEAQMLSRRAVTDLWRICKTYDIPVICYGLRTDFRSLAFTGASRLLEVADELEELITICECGKRAKMNARKVNGEYTLSGDTILIDGSCNNVSYVPLCGKCYIEKVMGKKN